MILKLSGHIGSAASALVDGQLTPDEEERAWAHVMVCAGCRRLVEREGWVKRQLAGLSDPGSRCTPSGLLGALYDTDSWAEVDAIERRSHRRRAVLAVVGAGSVGVAVLGLVTLTTVPVSRDEVPTLATAASAQAKVGVTRRAGLFGVPGFGSGLVPALEPEPEAGSGAASAVVAGASTETLVGATSGATTASSAGAVTPRARR